MRGVRLRFDIDDEDAALRTRDQLVERFASWLLKRPEAAPADE
jgi:hypothetical protein